MDKPKTTKTHTKCDLNLRTACYTLILVIAGDRREGEIHPGTES